VVPRKRISFGSLVSIELKKYRLVIAAKVKMMISIDVAPLSINLVEYEQLFGYGGKVDHLIGKSGLKLSLAESYSGIGEMAFGQR
jgi:hypothetical protein